MGFPIDVNRSSPDWPALAAVASYLGQHRSSNSHLYQRLREARGLNYGDYAYIEYFPRGMYQFTPDPNLARQQQIFQIWIRPVEVNTGVFTLRAALYEYDTLVRDGLSREAFEATREFLTKYSNILTQTQSARLGYALDSRQYGIGDYNTYLRDALAKLSVDDVNRAIRQHLAPNRMRIVIVTKDPKPFQDAVAKNTPSPITYNSPKLKDIMDEDAVIQAYRINATPHHDTAVLFGAAGGGRLPAAHRGRLRRVYQNVSVGGHRRSSRPREPGREGARAVARRTARLDGHRRATRDMRLVRKPPRANLRAVHRPGAGRGRRSHRLGDLQGRVQRGGDGRDRHPHAAVLHEDDGRLPGVRRLRKGMAGARGRTSRPRTRTENREPRRVNRWCRPRRPRPRTTTPTAAPPARGGRAGSRCRAS
jgi:hypothetical protein